MAKYRPTIKDRLLRATLGVTSNFRYICGIKRKRTLNIPAEYKLAYVDNFQNDYTYKWESSADWWEQPYHPEFPDSWYDASQIRHSSQGLELTVQKKPRYFPEIDITIPVALGSIRSKGSWKYGIFIFSALLPAGTHLWPALWLSGRWSWPPEIDILEGLSYDTNDYKKNRKLFSNVHVMLGEDNVSTRGIAHKLPVKVTEEFVEYALWWEKDFVEIYYNGYLVRKITDKRILDNLNEAQQVIIGTGVQPGFDTNPITPMIIESFEVLQKK